MKKLFLLSFLFSINTFPSFPRNVCSLYLDNQHINLSGLSEQDKIFKIKEVSKKKHCVLQQLGGTCWAASQKNLLNDLINSYNNRMNKNLLSKVSYAEIVYTTFIHRLETMIFGNQEKLAKSINDFFFENTEGLVRGEKNLFVNYIFQITGGGIIGETLRFDKFYYLDRNQIDLYEKTFEKIFDNFLIWEKINNKKKLSYSLRMKEEASALIELTKLMNELKGIGKSVELPFSYENLSRVRLSSIDLKLKKNRVLIAIIAPEDSVVVYNKKTGLIKMLKDNDVPRGPRKSYMKYTKSSHGMEVLGYLENKHGLISHFVLANSWGVDNGLDGFYYMAREDLVSESNKAFMFKDVFTP